MKRYLVENAGFIHMMLFFIWFMPLMATFIVGVGIFKEGTIIPLTALIAILLHICFAVVESDWVEDVSNESGY
jgi:hypothetical protein